jgi:hypothetical protein
MKNQFKAFLHSLRNDEKFTKGNYNTRMLTNMFNTWFVMKQKSIIKIQAFTNKHTVRIWCNKLEVNYSKY